MTFSLDIGAHTSQAVLKVYDKDLNVILSTAIAQGSSNSCPNTYHNSQLSKNGQVRVV